jgi:hypothetical protein
MRVTMDIKTRNKQAGIYSESPAQKIPRLELGGGQEYDRSSY